MNTQPLTQEQKIARIQSLSASFIRQMWMLKICKIEIDVFEKGIRLEEGLFKNIARLMRNEIKSLDIFHEQALKLLPKDAKKIELYVTDEKVLVLSSILSKISGLTLEQLEEVDESIIVEEVDE